ncbi:histidine kinase [bacterium]|nr:histidine kinase [bacterium]
MNIKFTKPRSISFWAIQGTLWSGFTLAYLFFYYPSIRNLRHVIGVCLIAITGFCCTSLLRFYYHRINPVGMNLSRLLRIVLLSSIVGTLAWYSLDQGLSGFLNGWSSIIKLIRSPRFIISIASSLMSKFILVSGWSASYFAFKLWTAWSSQKEQTDKARALAQEAQLQMLRYQLNPHFLFNSLNSIRALVDEDSSQAKAMITELSEFLRYSLINKQYSFVPLRQEIEATRLYLSIQKKRYEEKLAISISIDPDTEECPVLGFLIHPLVENAIKYGMNSSPMPLQLIVKSQRKDNQLIFSVANTGKWKDRKEQSAMNDIPGTGTGLENIKKRMENAYPDQHAIQIDSTNGWVKITLTMPFNDEVSHE